MTVKRVTFLQELLALLSEATQGASNSDLVLVNDENMLPLETIVISSQGGSGQNKCANQCPEYRFHGITHSLRRSSFGASPWLT